MNAAPRIFTARGWSMLPSILPGSELVVCPVEGDDVRPGDVLCYPADGGSVVAHRVVEVRREPEGKVFLTRGDAQTTCEEVPESAVTFKVLRVSYGPLSYSTDGAVGRALAEMAVRDGLLWRGGRWLNKRAGVRLLRSLARSRLRRPLKALVRARALDGDDFASFVKTEWGVSAADPMYSGLMEEHSRGERILIAAFLAGRVVGGAAVSRMWENAGIDELFVGGLWVHPGLRRIGIGAEIVRKALREARVRFENRLVYANIAVDNEASIRLFERAGFAQTADANMSKLIEDALFASSAKRKQQVVLKCLCR